MKTWLYNFRFKDWKSVTFILLPVKKKKNSGSGNKNVLGGTISGAGYIERGDPTHVRRNIVTVRTSGILRDKTIKDESFHIDDY